MEPVSHTKAYMANLLSYVESESTLEKYGHITQPLSDEQLSNRQRCRGCNLKPHQFKKSDRRIRENALKGAGGPGSENARKGKSRTKAESRAGREVLGNLLLCQFHPGDVVNKRWTGCSKHVSSQPCSGAKSHQLNTKSLRELADLYQFHHTPQHIASPSPGHSMRTAVALDCEMGTAETGESEPIRISMIDYFTGEVLVNSLVDPTVKMKTLHTKWSGVSWDDVRKARSDGTCIKGTAVALNAVWAHVGPETIVVGHSVQNDLRTLRWIHSRVVDSYIIAHRPVRMAQEAKKAREKADNKARKQGLKARMEQERDADMGAQVETGAADDAKEQKDEKKEDAGMNVSLSLKKFMKECLGKDVQTGKKGHDSLEDAVAARDLVHWQITQPKRG